MAMNSSTQALSLVSPSSRNAPATRRIKPRRIAQKTLARVSAFTIASAAVPCHHAGAPVAKPDFDSLAAGFAAAGASAVFPYVLALGVTRLVSTGA